MDRYGNPTEGETPDERKRRLRNEVDSMIGRAPKQLPANQRPVLRKHIAKPLLRTGRSRRLHGHINSKKRRKATAVLAAAQDNLCALCGNPFTAERPATLDHIYTATMRRPKGERVPLLQAAHGDCNNLRGNLSMSDFFAAVRAGTIKLPE